MVRAKSPDGRRVHMNVRFSEAEAAAIDEARGDVERGTWLRETVLRAALVVANPPVKPVRAQLAEMEQAEQAAAKRSRPAGDDPDGQQRVLDDFHYREADGTPRRRRRAVQAGPRASGGTATAVFQPAGAEPVVTHAVPAKTPVVVPSLRRASDLPVPPRCQHEGIRRIGGWCSKCMADVQPGGKLPADWVMPEGWPAS